MQMPPHLLDETLPLAGGRQHADCELLPVPPVPPGRRPGDPVGGRGACAARVYEIVNGSQFCFQSLSRDEREFL